MRQKAHIAVLGRRVRTRGDFERLVLELDRRRAIGKGYMDDPENALPLDPPGAASNTVTFG